jgi:hypothetical protein
MSSPEQGGNPDQPERPRPREAETPPYLRTARFPTEPQSNRAYTRAQRALYQAPTSDVSVFRLRLNSDWHLAALGASPPPNLADQFDAIFAAGEPATLPPEVVAMLMQRRAQATRIAPWVERHVRPVPPNDPEPPAQDGESRR